ncbi:SH3 domain-containing protein [Streptomyces sp. NPDC088400]|uniref:SH3 domain-containing protein n=1 Tax=Streptomyces sp. NPDC088400 TaxID=3365861 RepID=UPI0038192FB5
MNKLRMWTAAAVPFVLAASTLMVTAPSAGATAQACQSPGWSNKSTGVGHAKGASEPVHTGPNAGCTIIAYVGQNIQMDYDCWFKNSAGNKWTHVQSSVDGWVWNGNLDDGGSVAAGSKC